MTLQVRPIKESDWNFLPDWWKEYPAWKGESIPKAMLPGKFQLKSPNDITDEQEKTLGHAGFMVTKNDFPIAACWLFMTNSKLALVAPVVSDKGYRDTDRKDAISLLLHFTTQFAKDMGYVYCHAWSTHDGLTNLYADLGYISEAGTELTIKL